MENEEILRHVDHTLLRQTATWEEIKALCDEGIKYGVASVCIPPSRVGEEVRALTEFCHGKDRILKVIVETCPFDGSGKD